MNVENFQQDNNGFMTAYFGNVQYLYAMCRKDSPFEIENFVDIGSGDGAVVSFMARKFPKLNCFGIEIDKRLHDLAMNRISVGNSNLGYIHGSALDWDFSQLQKTTSVLFFFNSFGEKSLEILLGRLRIYCRTNGLNVYFIYLNDIHRVLLREKGIRNIYMNQRKQSVWQFRCDD